MVLGQIIATVGLPVLIDIIGRALGRVDHPVAKTASETLGTLKETVANGSLSEAQIAEANRHAEQLAQMDYQETQAQLAEINQSLRAEIASTDPYVRRMRPTFGYLMAVSWAAQMLGLAYIVVFETDKSAAVLEGMAALSTMWAVGLSVLGIYVYKRSEEKKTLSPGSLLDGIMSAKIRPAATSHGLNE
jgi:hypothetical protein